MPLTGDQAKQIHTALLNAFPTHGALAQMVRFGLDVNLDAIVQHSGLSEVVFKLIEWAEAQGKIEELLATANEQNPGNALLRDLQTIEYAATRFRRRDSAAALVLIVVALVVLLGTAALDSVQTIRGSSTLPSRVYGLGIGLMIAGVYVVWWSEYRASIALRSPQLWFL